MLPLLAIPEYVVYNKYLIFFFDIDTIDIPFCKALNLRARIKQLSLPSWKILKNTPLPSEPRIFGEFSDIRILAEDIKIR